MIAQQFSCTIENTNTQFSLPSNFDPSNYSCYDDDKIIKVNVHFVQTPNGTYNFAANHDGFGDTRYTGYDAAKDMIEFANSELIWGQEQCNYNDPNILPATPPNIRWRYALKGVYFPKADNKLKAFFNDSPPYLLQDNITELDPKIGTASFFNAPIDQSYKQDESHVINIFAFTHITRYYFDPRGPDYLELYPHSVVGYAPLGQGNSCAISSPWSSYLGVDNTTNQPVYNVDLIGKHCRAVNHEIAHMFGLWHDFDQDHNDYCLPHSLAPNGRNWCCSTTACSNNIVGYSCNQVAVLDCQETYANNVLHAQYDPDYVLTCLDETSTCQPSAAYTKMSNDVVCFKRGYGALLNIDSRGSSSFADQYRIEIQRHDYIGGPVLPSSAATTGLKSWNPNHNGYFNLVQEFPGYWFTQGVYRVRFFANNSQCPVGLYGDYYDAWFTLQGCVEVPNGGGGISMNRGESQNYNELHIYPNPAKSDVRISTTNTSGISEISIYDLTGRLILNKTVSSQGINKESIVQLPLLARGLYIARVQHNDSQILTHKLHVNQ